MNRGTMGVNSLPKTVTRQRRDCDLNPGPTAPESSTLTTRLASHPREFGTPGQISKSSSPSPPPTLSPLPLPLCVYSFCSLSALSSPYSQPLPFPSLPPSPYNGYGVSPAGPGGGRSPNAFCAIHSPKSANLLKVLPTRTDRPMQHKQ